MYRRLLVDLESPKTDHATADHHGLCRGLYYPNRRVHPGGLRWDGHHQSGLRRPCLLILGFCRQPRAEG